MHNLWVAGFAANTSIVNRPNIPKEWHKQAIDNREITNMHTVQVNTETQLATINAKPTVCRANSKDVKFKKNDTADTHLSNNTNTETSITPETSHKSAESQEKQKTPVTNTLINIKKKSYYRTRRIQAPAIIPVIISGQKHNYSSTKRPISSIIFEATLPCAVSTGNF